MMYYNDSSGFMIDDPTLESACREGSNSNVETVLRAILRWYSGESPDALRRILKQEVGVQYGMPHREPYSTEVTYTYPTIPIRGERP